MPRAAKNKFHALRSTGRGLIASLARRCSILSAFLPASLPLRCRDYRCEDPATELIVFLPGIDDVLEDYESHGFIQAVRQRKPGADIVVADLHFGYYLRQTAIERLHEDVILPARTRGYQCISLVGISLGGFGALYYAMNHPDEIARLIVLAPYLGDSGVIEEVSQGNAMESRPGKKSAERDTARKLWLWLMNFDDRRIDLNSIYLGYGLQDKFASTNRRLGKLLPADHVRTLPGSHDWQTWTRLWNLFLHDLA
jgi:pimeloyl-ACP methyl ester carboxylesterase